MMVDFHSHLLPCVDDGSTSVQESVALLRLEAEQGVWRVVATPHFYPRHDSLDRFLERRAAAEHALRAEMQQQDGLPELSIGAEVSFFPGISESDVAEKLTIDGKNGILIEMPASPWTDAMYRELERLAVRRGLTPIIAHVERYMGRFRTFGIPERLAELPVLVQANADSFLKRSVSARVLRMLERGQIHLLGSDCHDLTTRRPHLGAAEEVIRKHLGDEQIARIRGYGQQILFNP